MRQHVLLVLHDGMNPSSSGSETDQARADLIGALPSFRRGAAAFAFALPCTKCEFDHIEILGLIGEVPFSSRFCCDCLIAAAS